VSDVAVAERLPGTCPHCSETNCAYNGKRKRYFSRCGAEFVIIDGETCLLAKPASDREISFGSKRG
jgi:hypothetical protein